MAYDDDYFVRYDSSTSEDGFDAYEETTVNPGNWAIFSCLLVSFVVMFLVMPYMVYRQKQSKRAAKIQKQVSMLEFKSDKRAEATPGSYMFVQNTEPEHQEPDEFASQYKKIRATFRTIVRMDQESKRILNYALPFTVSALVSAILGSTVLALVGHFVGTKELAAIAVTDILLSLVEDFLQGPLSANITLCAHAVGASNEFLAGQYVQLSLIFYFVLQVPFLFLWYLYTDDIILFLGWGDEEEASYGLAYVRIAIWGVVMDCIHAAFENLLEVTGHEYYTTFMGLVYDGAVVLILVIMIVVGVDLNVELVALVYLATSAFFLALTIGLAFLVGWLEPFRKGIFRNFALKNRTAMSNMIKTAAPLTFGSILSNAEWAILTVFASHMGLAEVAAWAVLGSIWEVFESTTEGIGDAAEIRVAYHLGNNHPSMAKLSTYKSLYFGMILASTVSGVMFFVMDDIPAWFTMDETLQSMIGECLPLIGIGNILMTFGMLCWYMVGAQGRYKIATWVHFGTSYGITLPLAALSVYVWNFDLQALTFSVVVGYVGVGASLAYMLLTSDWAYRAYKIQRQNAMEDEDDDEDDEESDQDDDELYMLLQARRSRAARATATGNIKLLTAPAGPLGIGVDFIPHRVGPTLTTVLVTSPFRGMCFPGDSLLSVDGTNVLSLSLERIHELFVGEKDKDRQLTVMSATPCHYQEEGTSKVLLSGTVPDIPDFEEEETIFPHWWEDQEDNDEHVIL